VRNTVKVFVVLNHGNNRKYQENAQLYCHFQFDFWDTDIFDLKPG